AGRETRSAGEPRRDFFRGRQFARHVAGRLPDGSLWRTRRALFRTPADPRAAGVSSLPASAHRRDGAGPGLPVHGGSCGVRTRKSDRGAKYRRVSGRVRTNSRQCQAIPRPGMNATPASLLPFPARLQSGTRAALVKAFRGQVEALKSGRLRWHVPRLQHCYESRSGMPYHFKPEIFLQLSGVTEFTFPEEQITLQPGSVCIVPRGLPHGERARADQAAFENIVVSFYNGTIYVHFGHERSRGRPAVDSVNFFSTELFDDLILYLDRIAGLHHADAARHEVAIRALLLAEFSLLLGVIEMPAPHQPPATDIVALCKWLIHQRLQDEQLNLEMLATELGVSPSYLSRSFHRKVGERIVEHINRLRLENAADTLRQTRVSVKVIAAGCGYRDAGYFGRLFRQATGCSPQEYRRAAERNAASLEPQPK